MRGEFIILVYFILIAGLAFFLILNKNRLFSFYVFFILWFSVVSIFGLGPYYILEELYGISGVNYLNYYKILILFLLYVFVFALSYNLPWKFPRIKLFPSINEGDGRLIGMLFIFISLIAFAYYYYKNGLVLLDISAYTERYEANIGLGIVTRLLPLYIPGFVILFLLTPTRRNLIIYGILGAILGVWVYVLMGGYRQILVIHIFTFLILAYHKKFIKLGSIIIFGIFSIYALAAMAMLRYGQNIGTNNILSLVIATVDTLSPISSFSNILDYYANTKSSFLGCSVWINEVSSLVPRFLWHDKPMQVINAGNYYTQEIIDYKRSVTISPTLLGSAYIVAGNTGILITAFINGILYKWFDVKFYNTNKHVINTKGWNRAYVAYCVFYYYVLFYTFVAAREGLEVFVQRFIAAYILFLFVMIAAKYSRKLMIIACAKTII